MSRSLPYKLDPFQFAEHDGYLQGSASLKSMDRLLEATAESDDQEVFADLWFAIQASGVCVLHGHVETHVQMICQRCLGAVKMKINRNIELALVRSEAEAALVEEQYEAYQVGKNDTLFIPDLLEEELLLSLPIVPMHANSEQCNQVMLQILKRNSSEQFSEHGRNPFAVLKDLKSD